MCGRLEDPMGPEEAAKLMAHLPPVGWAGVAARRDLEALAVEIRGEMAVLEGDLRAEMAELRGELRACSSPSWGCR